MFFELAALDGLSESSEYDRTSFNLGRETENHFQLRVFLLKIPNILVPFKKREMNNQSAKKSIQNSYQYRQTFCAKVSSIFSRSIVSNLSKWLALFGTSQNASHIRFVNLSTITKKSDLLSLFFQDSVL